MSALTAPFDVPTKHGEEIRIAAAAVKWYRGGAASIVLGTGYATPLVPATVGSQFIGVYTDGRDNSAGSAGVGLNGWANVKREGIFAFNQSGLNQATVGQRAYFSDDNTVTTTVGAIFAGIIVAIDEANSLAWVDIANAVMGPNGIITLGASGAITPSLPATYVITKAGVAAMTLAAPTAGTDDGKIIVVTSDTANAHTITATGLLDTGSASVNVATFAAQKGAGVTLMAYNGRWKVLGSVGITFS